MTRNRGVAALAVFIAGVAAAQAAGAPAPLAFVTPAWISGKIHGLSPQIPTDNTSPISTITQAACKGLPPKRKGKFNTFRCAVRWDKGPGIVWARALPGGKWCASSTGLASCPAAAAAAGDPRICATGAPGPTTADPNRCALAATEYSILRAMPLNFSDPGWTMRNLSCNGSNLKRTCSFSSRSAFGTYYTSTIIFAQGADTSWTATLTTTGGGGSTGNGSTSCTVVPGPPSARGRWQAGPAPTCTATS